MVLTIDRTKPFVVMDWVYEYGGPKVRNIQEVILKVSTLLNADLFFMTILSVLKTMRRIVSSFKDSDSHDSISILTRLHC